MTVLAPASLVASLALLAIPGVEAADEARAMTALRAALELRYPAVEAWDLRPMGKHSAADPGSDVTPQVLQLGGRSAVALGGEVHWYAVSGRQRVWVMRHPVAARALVGPDDVEWVDREVLAARCEPLANQPPWTNLEATHALSSGQLLCMSHLGPRRTIRRGDGVDVEVVTERVAVRSRAVALEDGSVGDTIGVLNAQTHVRYRGRVLGAGALQVDLRKVP